MKARLSLTLDPEVTHRAKRYARARNQSLSSLVEDLLDKLATEELANKRPQTKPFSQRWANAFKPARRSDERYRHLSEKYGL
jgi:hypothetical protein